jgi:hypothetical protein
MTEKKIVSIFDKFDLEGMIHFTRIESKKRTADALKRSKELREKLAKGKKVNGGR